MAKKIFCNDFFLVFFLAQFFSSIFFSVQFFFKPNKKKSSYFDNLGTESLPCHKSQTWAKKKLWENWEIPIFTMSVKIEDKQKSWKDANIGLAQDLKLTLMNIELT